MICKNCGGTVAPGKDTCDICGETVETETLIEESAAEPKEISFAEEPWEKDIYTKKATNKKIPYIVGMIASLCAVVMSLVLIFGGLTSPTPTGSSASTKTTEYQYYGGDAYTGMQQAAADASNNAAAVAENVSSAKNVAAKAADNLQDCISTSVGVLCLIISGLGFCYFFVGFSKKN